MNTRTTRNRLLTGLTAAVAAGTLALGASPASASASSGYISGAGSLFDDFGDEGTLSTSSYASSNTTCFWQRILWAMGANESAGNDFDLSDIDGHFGAKTKYATKNLQGAVGLTVDGKVGNKTFGNFDAQRVWNSDLGEYTGRLTKVSTASNGTVKVKFTGSAHNFFIYRGPSGRYTFPDGSGTYRDSSYSHNYCD
ncbi:peptidoglycan-binding protein [Streptomyces sp. NBC_00663]|uniref:peptidoglycan-binding domain-containing protein n=1 Tax=Streptomyces sp. NBC_00663 TaxID=2975801 RepID=UPI002E2EF430|nr:peptidoglycan-binding domain-containing protein [Streptomyces sp. NBC_00663]